MSLIDSLLEDELLASELKPMKELFFAVRADTALGDGTRENPFSAASFDRLMDAHAKANCFVHLGPGVFFTQGGPRSAGDYILRMYDGMRIQGAGMFNTVLRLRAKEITDPTQTAAREFPVIGTFGTAINNAQICDLTIDCDLGNQPETPGRDFAVMALKAIELNGTNNRIRRVRVINFGTRTPAVLNGIPQTGTGLPGSAESFVFYNLGDGAIIEDCLLEQPFLGTARETSILLAGGATKPTAIRHNYVDAAFVNPRNGFPTRVTSLSSAGTSPATITITTQFPHNVKEGDYIEVKGASPAEYNGRWLVKTPSEFDGTSRILSFDIPNALGAASGSITVEQSFQPTLPIVSAVWAGGFLTVTTAQKHFRQAGDWVVISGADLKDVAGVATDFFNGSYKVESSGLTETEFKVACAGDGALEDLSHHARWI